MIALRLVLASLSLLAVMAVAGAEDLIFKCGCENDCCGGCCLKGPCVQSPDSCTQISTCANETCPERQLGGTYKCYGHLQSGENTTRPQCATSELGACAKRSCPQGTKCSLFINYSCLIGPCPAMARCK